MNKNSLEYRYKKLGVLYTRIDNKPKNKPWGIKRPKVTISTIRFVPITDKVLNFVERELALNTTNTINSVLEHLDSLEIKQPEDLKTDNWRNWKYIRNSIVDKWKIRTQPWNK